MTFHSSPVRFVPFCGSDQRGNVFPPNRVNSVLVLVFQFFAPFFIFWMSLFCCFFISPFLTNPPSPLSAALGEESPAYFPQCSPVQNPVFLKVICQVALETPSLLVSDDFCCVLSEYLSPFFFSRSKSVNALSF